MVRLVVVGDLQRVAREVLEQLGFSGAELDSVYRLSLATFRRRVVPALEQSFAREIERAVSRRGLGPAIVEVRAIKTRRTESGELTELSSRATGNGSDRIRLTALEAEWNNRLRAGFEAWVQENITWILAVIRQQPGRGQDQDSWFA